MHLIGYNSIWENRSYKMMSECIGFRIISIRWIKKVHCTCFATELGDVLTCWGWVNFCQLNCLGQVAVINCRVFPLVLLSCFLMPHFFVIHFWGKMSIFVAHQVVLGTCYL